MRGVGGTPPTHIWGNSRARIRNRSFGAYQGCCSYRATTRTKGKGCTAAGRNSVADPFVRQLSVGKMMASEDKQVKTETASKNEAAPEKTNTGIDESKGEGSKAAASPSGYSRG